MAKSNSLGDVVVNLEARDVSLTRGLLNFENRLKGAERSLKQFNTISKLAFGVGAGAMAFSLAHEGLTTLIGGFTEATAANMSFGDSMGNAIEKLLGMETRLQSATKRTEEFKTAQQQLVAAIHQANQAQRAAQGYKPVARFPGLGNSAEAQASLAALQAAARDADTAAAPGRVAIAAARQRIADIEARPARKGSERDKANVLALARDELRALEAQWSSNLQLAEKAEAQWKAELANFQKTEAAAKKAAASVDMYAAAMADADRATEKWRVAEEARLKARQKWVEQEEQIANDHMAAMADARKEEEARAQAIIDSLDPLHEFRKTIENIEELAGMGLLTDGERDAAVKNAMGQFEPQSARQRSQFIGLEDMARTIQTGIGGDTGQKQVDLLTRANKLAEEIRNNTKPRPAVFQ